MNAQASLSNPPRCLTLVATLILMVATGAHRSSAADGDVARPARPLLSIESGAAADSPWLNPGKIDFLYRGRDADNSYNAFAWTPVFKGGGGTVAPKSGESTTYLGGFLRPLQGWPDKGELILGAQGVEANNRRDIEAQAEYRLPFGLGIGGGFVEAREAGNDIQFAKLTWRNKIRRWNYILELQGQDVEHSVSPGGYLAVYDDQFMTVLGHDGEQWRATAGYVAPTNRTIFRPAAEVLYVDNAIGEFDGPRSIFVNGTLRLQGGFLSHPARLGRAMGPQGLEFGNPLGFLFPTWNRRLETWEMGGLLDVRYEHIWLPNHTKQERADAALFPFQFLETRSLLDGLFVGASYTRTPAMDNPGVIGGILRKVAFLNANISVERRVRPYETIVVVGLIDWF